MLMHNWASLVAHMVRNLPAMKKPLVRALGWEEPLEKRMVTHSSIRAWRIPWTEEYGGLQSMGSQRVGHNWVTNAHTQWTINNWHFPICDMFLEKSFSACVTFSR